MLTPAVESMSPTKASWPQLYLCVAMTTLATLLLELSLTRIFSVVFFYHMAFLAISIALFGLGAGGVFSYLVAGWKGSLLDKLGRMSAVNGLLIVGSLTVILQTRGELTTPRLMLIYFTSALPFFIAGAIVSLAISETVERIDRVYFFDLLGAAGGCLVLVPLLNSFGGPNTVLSAAVLFAAAGAIWHNMARSAGGRVFSVALGLALVALVVVNWKAKILDVRYAKGNVLRGEEWVQWNSFSRISLENERDAGMKTIVIDSDASTGVAKFDFARLTQSERNDLTQHGESLPYAIRPGAKTLIIGPGGGWDVSRALASGSKDVTGVEINRIIADEIMRKRFPHYSNNLYLRPDVRIEVEDGRSFVRRSQETYQVLQATLVDTWASTAAGAFALSENNLYTTEAFEDYLRRLTPDGMLAFTRWGFDPPRESLRLIALARVALANLGEHEAWKHVIVGREGSVQGWGAKDTVLISRKPFSPADIEKARHVMTTAKVTPVYLPDEEIANPFTGYLRASDPRAFERAYVFDISPVSDNRPFFFYSVQPRDLWAFLQTASRESADYKINRAVPLLFGLMGISLAATAIILALPPLVLGTRLPREPGVLKFLLYFLSIGTGYILIEVALIQKFVLLLGHPTYALTVVIFSMLVASGIGSYFSRRLIGESSWRWGVALAAIVALVGVLALLAGPVLRAGVAWPLPLKIAVTVLLIAPAGFVMGMPFPIGLAHLEAWHKPSVRWAWSLNAASSVLGSVLAMVCAIYLGLIQTLLVGGVMYAAALALKASPSSGTLRQSL